MGTTNISVDPASPTVQLAFIRAHLRMMALGLKNRKLRQSDLIKLAGKYMGREYAPRTRPEPVIADITAYLNSQKELTP